LEREGLTTMNLAMNRGGLLVVGEKRRKESDRLWQIRARAMVLTVQLAFMRWQRSCCMPWPSQAVAETPRAVSGGDVPAKQSNTEVSHPCNTDVATVALSYFRFFFPPFLQFLSIFMRNSK
jgi:hypothetical protein